MAIDEAMTIIPLAHLLHWYFLPLYAAPILIVLYSTIRETIRQRREAGASKPSGKDGRRRR